MTLPILAGVIDQRKRPYPEFVIPAFVSSSLRKQGSMDDG
jgi:hypothetical protein